MKKCVFLIFTLSIFLISLIGCSKKEEKEIIVYPYLRLGFQLGKDSQEYKTAVKFKEKVSELSYGEIDIKIFPNGYYGDDIKMINDVSTGALDITYGEMGRLGLWLNEAELFGYPFAFDDIDHLKRTLDSDYGNYLKQKLLSKGLRILATGYNGSRHTTSNTPIYSMDDMKNMKLRVPKSLLNERFAEYAGANPIIIDFKDVYNALKIQVIDGQENPLTTIEAQKFYEVQKYCALTGHIINDNNFIISEKSFQKLSPKHQKIITDAAIYAANYQTDMVKEQEAKLVDELESQGMTFTTPDKEPFRNACLPMYTDYAKKYGTAALEAIKAAKLVKTNN